MIPTPTMLLERPEAGDLMEPYFLGTQPTGGFWTILMRLSEHDHTGGVNGKTLTAATIPDGSITPSKLHPSVYTPLAFVDGSKPITGQQEFQADAIIRDALHFGEQGTALAPDAHLTRTSAGVLKLGGDTATLALDPATDAGNATLQFFDRGAARYTLQAGGTENGGLYLYFHGITGNTGFRERAKWEPTGTLTLTPDAGADALRLNKPDAANYLAYQTFQRQSTGKWVWGLGPGDEFVLYNGDLSKTRQLVSPTGTLTLTPDAGQAALVATGVRIQQGAGSNGEVASDPGSLQLFAANGIVHPRDDGTINLGHSSKRWSAVYAVAGTINTSAAEMKQDITPLDPAAALAAVLNTDPVVFDYRPPVRDAAWYELPDDPEQAETILHQRLTAAPLEAAARHQAGFVLQDATGQYQTDPLFETGEGQSNAANSVGVILAAIHALSSRLDALEGA